MVTEEETSKLSQILSGCSSHRKHAHNRTGSDFSGRQRCSLAEMNRKYFGNDSATLLKPIMECREERRKKKVYKLF